MDANPPSWILIQQRSYRNPPIIAIPQLPPSPNYSHRRKRAILGPIAKRATFGLMAKSAIFGPIAKRAIFGALAVKNRQIVKYSRWHGAAIGISCGNTATRPELGRLARRRGLAVRLPP